MKAHVNAIPTLLLCALALFQQACAPAAPSVARGKVATQANSPRPDASPSGPFDEYVRAEFAPADGFDFPFGDGEGGGSYTDIATGKRYSGWYKAPRFAEEYSLGIHTGEDWNGAGGGATDLGQPVYSVANGRVVFADNCGRLWGNVVVLEHVFYENQERREIRSLYAHLNEIKVRAGQEVRRRQLIATVGQDPEKLFGAHLHLELRRDATPLLGLRRPAPQRHLKLLRTPPRRLDGRHLLNLSIANCSRVRPCRSVPPAVAGGYRVSNSRAFVGACDPPATAGGTDLSIQST
jgi:murein DD-endopeptidase MepM/ murein hydrolase activator NlpD